MNEKILQLENRIAELESRLNAFNAGYSVPASFEGAIRDRLIQNLIITKPTTDIDPDDRDQTTSAGGGDLVPQVFTGLIKADFNGVTVYIPYYQ